jgi:RecA/RadA recombinase
MLKTGNNDLDLFLKDIERGIILVYGGGATGKTTFGLQCSLEHSFDNKKVLFLDTENSFSLERIKQMKKDYEKYLENTFVVNLNSFEELDKKLDFFEKVSDKFNLIVLDTFGVYYRLKLQKEGYVVANEFAIKILRKLKHISKTIPVILINQVYENEKGSIALGGQMIKNFSNYILEFSKEPRKIKMIKPLEKEFSFEIKAEGIVEV